MNINVIKYTNSKDIEYLLKKNNVIISFWKFETDNYSYKDGFIQIHEIENDPYIIITELSSKIDFNKENTIIVCVPVFSENELKLALKELSNINCVKAISNKDDSGYIFNVLI